MSLQWSRAVGVVALLGYLSAPRPAAADQRFRRILQRLEDPVAPDAPPDKFDPVLGSRAENTSDVKVARALLSAKPGDGKEHKVKFPISKDQVPVPGLDVLVDNVGWATEKMDTTWEAMFAILWVAIIVSGPLLVARMDGKAGHHITWTRIAGALVTVAALVGGIVAFTTTIMFESSHFEGIRTLTIVESVYLLSQIITTVGYGDITPTYQRGQVVVAFYVLLCLFLIADVVAQLSDIILKKVQLYAQEAADLAAQGAHRVRHSVSATDASAAAAAAAEAGTDAADDQDEVDELVRGSKLFGRPEVDWTGLKTSCSSFFFFFVIGVLFYHYFPGENKTWLQAIYMSVITLSTTGFGAFTADTEWGKVFGAFWMLFGVAALCCFVSAFTEIVLKLKELDKFKSGVMKQRMKDGLTALGKQKMKLHNTDFLCWASLQLEFANQDTLKSIERAFDNLKKDADDTVSVDDFMRNHLPKGATAEPGSGGSTPRSQRRSVVGPTARLPQVVRPP